MNLMIRVILIALVFPCSGALHAQAQTTTTNTSSTTLGMQRKIRAAEDVWADGHPGRGPTKDEARELVEDAKKLPPGQVKKIEKDHGHSHGGDS